MTDSPWFAVIGTGRSGTGYVSQLLTHCGLVCGHEAWWNPWQQRQHTPALDGDASWLALPDVEAGRFDGRVLHIVREPVAVVRSLVGIGFFSRQPSSLTEKHQPFADLARREVMALRSRPTRTTEQQARLAVEWWVGWNRRCAAVAHATVRLEELPGEEALGVVAECLRVPRLEPSRLPATDVNHRERAALSEAVVLAWLDGREQEFGYLDVIR